MSNGVRLDPLGQPLDPWEMVVTGPPHTGPRLTVVDTRAGARLQPWVVPVPLPYGGVAYVDNGQPGGTYRGPQELPEVVTRAPRDWRPLLLIGVFVALAALGVFRGRGAVEW